MCLPARTHVSYSKDKKCESHLWPKVMTQNSVYHFYPSAKSRRELKIRTSGVVFQGTSAYYVPKSIAPPKQAVWWFSDEIFLDAIFYPKFLPKFLFGVEKWDVGDHLKYVFPKFEAERSHPRGVSSCSKFCKKILVGAFWASKNEMSGIVWSMFSQSLKPNGAILTGQTSVQSFPFLRVRFLQKIFWANSWTPQLEKLSDPGKLKTLRFLTKKLHCTAHQMHSSLDIFYPSKFHPQNQPHDYPYMQNLSINFSKQLKNLSWIFFDRSVDDDAATISRWRRRRKNTKNGTTTIQKRFKTIYKSPETFHKKWYDNDPKTIQNDL